MRGMHVRTVGASGAVGVLLGAVALSGTGHASPTLFKLEMKNGFHTVTEDAAKFPLGFRHEGPFTASEPFCAAGDAMDLELRPPVEVRQFVCADRSGSITARKIVVRSTPQFTHEEGTWAIIEGTGRYSTLRGKGTLVLDTISGDPDDHITTRFDETWSGVIDFDVTRPDVRVSQASAKRLPHTKGIYLIRVAFSAQDGSEANAVAYVITLSGGGVFVRRRGTATSKTVSTAFRVRPSKGVHELQLGVVASDPVGNETTVALRLKLLK
jgi:hypothetical protein